MDINMSEQDQIEMLKKWWNKYGKVGVLAILLAVGGNMAWDYFKNKKVHNAEYASVLYEQMHASLEDKNIPEFKARATYILENYKSSPYAGLAYLALSTQAVKSGNFDDAKANLQIVIDTDKNMTLQQIARIRKARILSSQKAYDEALQILSTVNDKTYIPLIEEIRGDIYSVKGEKDKARNAYKAALGASEDAAQNRQILQMKYDQLAI